MLLFLSAVNLYAAEDGGYVKEFLKANTLINEGHIKEALPILEGLNKSVDDETIVIKLGEVYIALGKYEDFKALMNSTLKKNKFAKNASIRKFYANMLINIFNDIEEATNQIKKAIDVEPSAENYLLLSRVCEQKKDFSCAISAYDKVLELEKKPEYYFRRGMLYYQLDLRGKAVADFENSLKLEKSFMPMLMIAEIYIQDNKSDEAIKYLEEAVKEKPGLVIPEYRLAELYRIKGDFTKALSFYELVVDKVGEREKVYVTKQIAGLYFEMRDFDKAYEWFKKLEEMDKRDTQVYYYLAVTSEFKKDYATAVNYYKELLQKDPGSAFAKKRLAFSYMKLKDYSNALKTLEGIENNDIDIDYFRIKAAIYEEKKDSNLQLKTLLLGLEKFPNSEEILLDLADYYEKIKKYDKVEEYLRKILAINQNNASALNYLGYMFADLNKNLDEAHSLITRALSIEPNNAAFLDSMAWVLYRQKKYTEALEYQKKALKVSPNEKEMIDHMKEIMKALGINKSIQDILNEK